MIEFYDFKINGKFRYLWLKYVTGVNLNVHCARSLSGEYSEQIKKDIPLTDKIIFDEQPANILYLCGVASPFNWENNFHLAMQLQPGADFSFDEKNLSAQVKNAVRLPITTEAMVRVNHEKIEFKSYSTCRNWQFANFLTFFPDLLTKQ